jgi:hypothetical protein
MTIGPQQPMSIGTLFAIIILAGVVAGALLGVLRAELGGSAFVTGGLAGGIAGGLTAFLFRRRRHALRSEA